MRWEYNLVILVLYLLQAKPTRPMSEQSACVESSNVLQNMTSAMKFYKATLQHIETQYKSLICEGACARNMKLQQSIANLMRAVGTIHDNSRKKIYRLVGRFIEITTIYRNKCSNNESMSGFRDHITAILMIIRNYQSSCYTESYANNNNNNNNTNTNTNENVGINLSHLFDKVMWVFRNVIKQLNQLCRKNGNITVVNSQSRNLLEPQVSCPIFKDKQKQRERDLDRQRQRERQRQRQRRNSLSQAPHLKSLQYKYKVTKQIVENVALLTGMELDASHLRGLFFQARNNLADVQCDKIQANNEIKKCRNQYMQKYNQWKLKMRRKNQRKQKLIKICPSSPTKLHPNKSDIKNRVSPCKLHPPIQKISSSQQTTSLTCQPKMPKLFQNSHIAFSGTSSLTPIVANYEQDRKRSQFRNMQTFIFNRQFIHLSEIKNQKIARRPYAEVKQVLVAGDELNYYSSKKQIQELAAGYQSKASFFMQRAIKNEKLVRKKSYLENYRVPTEQ